MVATAPPQDIPGEDPIQQGATVVTAPPQEHQDIPGEDPTQQVIVQYHAKDSKPPPNPEDCNVFPSLFGAPDEDCYIEQPLPHLQEFIKEVLSEKISSLTSRAIMDVLIATGNEAIVDAIMAKSLTPQQAELLKKVSLDPKVAEALAQVRDRLLQGVDESIKNVKKTVLPQVQDAAGELVSGTVSSVLDEVKDIPPFGAVSGILTGANTLLNAAEAIPEIQQEITSAIQPVKDGMGELGNLTKVVNDVAGTVPDVPDVSGTLPNVPAVSDAAVSDETIKSALDAARANNKVILEGDYLPPNKKSTKFIVFKANADTTNPDPIVFQFPTLIDINDVSQIIKIFGGAGTAFRVSEQDFDNFKKTVFNQNVDTWTLTNTHVQNPNNNVISGKWSSQQMKGGSRTRRRIHKLSRRIERTLRRVQKKYGLQDDKNDFLRRTLRPPQTPRKGQ